MENKKTGILKLITLMLAIFLALGSVAYIVCRVITNQRHEDKWSQYDECGI